MLSQLLCLASLAFAINCKKLNLDILDQTFELQTTVSTPPSVTTKFVYFNPCSPVGIEGCAEDDHLCVIEKVKFPDQSESIRAIKGYGSKAAGAKEQLFQQPDVNTFIYEGATWGESTLNIHATIQCGRGDNAFIEDYGRGDLTIGSGIFCPGFEDDPDTPSKPGNGKPGNGTGNGDGGEKKKQSGGWGFFTYLFVFLLLGVVVYAALTVYVNFAQSKGNLPLAADISDVLRDLPYLIRDLIRKIKASFSSQSSSGYTAL